MKKFCLLVLIICVVITNTAIAAQNMSSNKNIGIIIIGSDEFKSEVYFNRSAAIFNADKNPNISVEVGDVIQEKFSAYCKDNELSDNEAPKLENLLDFTKQNNLNQVLCLVIKKPEISEKIFEKTGRLLEATVSMSINSYLCDQTKLLKTHSVTKQKTQDDNHSRHPKDKATRGAFTLCINDIGKAINGQTAISAASYSCRQHLLYSIFLQTKKQTC